jgi:acetylornithine deacetylase/succinyl-diaminopimelate desuccinylase-like protein
LLDIRILPGQPLEDVPGLLRDLLGELGQDVEISVMDQFPSSISSKDTELWRAIEGWNDSFYGDSELVPMLVPGGTDAKYFRLRGIPAYGYGFFSDKLVMGDFLSRFHGNDERVDVESLTGSGHLFATLPYSF